MPQPALRFLEYVFLALLYLFFLRVVRAVWVELRELRLVAMAPEGGEPEPAPGPDKPGAGKVRRAAPSKLVVVAPDGGEAYSLGDELTIGRAPGCAVPLMEDNFVSQVHARVFRRADGYWVEDLGLTNGTLVNGAPYERCRPSATGRPLASGTYGPGAEKMSKLLVGSATDVGLVRSNNQDQLLVAPGLYAVADGMGGHAAGEVASSSAIRALQAAFEASDQHSTGSLESAAKAANRAVWEQARANRGMFGMGTTLVALAVVEKDDGTNGLAVAHIGDSRLYLLRDQVLHQLTVDHSLVQELVDDGQISSDQAAVHPQRHVLTRALGVEPSVDVDLIDISPSRGDRYVLCSDGLPREASDDQIAAVLTRFADPTEAAKELVALAKSRGGSDNITVVIVDVLASDSSPDTLIVVPGPGGPGPASPARRTGRGRAPESVAVKEVGITGAGGHDGGGEAPTVTAVRYGPGPAAALPPPMPDLPTRSVRLAASPAKTVTWRVVSFVVALCIVVGGAIACIGWYARSAYFVTLSHGRITVFQGRPGGVLWFEPTLANRTPYTSSSVLAYNLPALEAGHLEPSLAQARLYIGRLVSEKKEAEPTTPAGARGAPRPAPARPLQPQRGRHRAPRGRRRRQRGRRPPPWPKRAAPREVAGMKAVQWQQPARRRTELGMIALVLLLTGGLYTLATLGRGGALPAHIVPFLVLVLALMLAAHISLRRLAPNADPVLLPLVALLNGTGYVFITGLDSAEASAQATWTAIAVACFVATLALFPRAISLERYRYTIALGGITLLLLPLVPHIGQDINGARLWVRVGPLNFQPEEFAKVALAIFFASVLAERADLLATGTRRIGRWLVLEPRYVAPLIAAWGVSLLVLLAENDLGSSFLFFTLFVSLLWVATGRWAYLALGAGLFTAGAIFALDVIHHAQTRVQAWLDPWAHFATSGYQIIEGWFALAAGGMWGLGPGQGNPQIIPEASTDFIFASIGEEIGLVGLTGLLITYLLIVGSGLRVAIRSQRSFSKLLATGLSLLLGVQVFVVVGGITRLIPITGITLPFVSYGGSSLVSNYILLAVLLRISNDNANEQAMFALTREPAVPAAARAGADGRSPASGRTTEVVAL